MSDNIILLSSDDEFENPPSKKIKTDESPREKLKDFKEISLFTQKGNDIINLDESIDSFSEQKTEPVNDFLVVPSDSEIENIDEDEQLDKTIEQDLDKTIEENPEEKQNGVEPHIEKEVLIETKPETNLLERPSTSKSSEAQKLFDEFLETCTISIKDSKYESRITPVFEKIKRYFEKCQDIHDEPQFKKMIQEHIITAKISAPEAVVTFQRLYSYLLDHINGCSIEVSEEDLIKIKKLQRTCKLILKRLKKLDEMEVNFDDEEDSTYIQIDRYSQRLDKVYRKYCQLLKKSPHAGRLLYERVHFMYSDYNEINRAITKSYKNNKFPTYYDIEKCIRKCTVKHNLGLSEHQIKEESKHCFTKIGNLLQMRRKKELYEIHCGFIALNEDPATTDDNLKNQLQKNAIEGETKLKEVIEKYTKMQDNNVNVDLSADSDDSNYESSDSDGESK